MAAVAKVTVYGRDGLRPVTPSREVRFHPVPLVVSAAAPPGAVVSVHTDIAAATARVFRRRASLSLCPGK